MPKPTSSELILPPPGLADCLAAVVARDTRQLTLNDRDRLNYFPASPLVTVTMALHGRLHMSPTICDLKTLRGLSPMPDLFVAPPQPRPVMSWSPGAIMALTLGFYPDAWLKLGGAFDAPHMPPAVASAMGRFDDADTWRSDCASGFAALAARWQETVSAKPATSWPGGSHVGDWSRHLLARAAQSGPGRSARALERRVRRWTGQSRQSLEFFTRIEALHGLTLRSPDASPSQIALDARFSDQSHMGRAVKRATGFSPARLNRLIETEEPFWCYRLLGERF